jgi:translin
VTDVSAHEPELRRVLDERFQARERGIADSRLIIRSSANSIRALHRGELEEAQRLADEAGSALADVIAALANHPDILNAGFIDDAAKEYAEARLSAALFQGQSLPSPADLGIDPVPYLNGLGEAVGELRRRLLDLLRDGDLEEAGSAMETMDQIVDLLASLDYPDGMTNGLRRTTDVARSLAERSRSDLTTTVVQDRLRRRLDDR